MAGMAAVAGAAVAAGSGAPAAAEPRAGGFASIFTAARSGAEAGTGAHPPVVPTPRAARPKLRAVRDSLDTLGGSGKSGWSHHRSRRGLGLVLALRPDPLTAVPSADPALPTPLAGRVRQAPRPSPQLRDGAARGRLPALTAAAMPVALAAKAGLRSSAPTGALTPTAGSVPPGPPDAVASALVIGSTAASVARLPEASGGSTDRAAVARGTPGAPAAPVMPPRAGAGAASAANAPLAATAAAAPRGSSPGHAGAVRPAALPPVSLSVATGHGGTSTGQTAVSHNPAQAVPVPVAVPVGVAPGGSGRSSMPPGAAPSTAMAGAPPGGPAAAGWQPPLTSVHLRVTPPGSPPVDVRVRVQGGQVRAAVTVDQAAAAQALTLAAPELHRALGRHGLSLATLGVGVRGEGGARHGASGWQGRARDRPQVAGEPAPPPGRARTGTFDGGRVAGGLDLRG